MRLTNNVPVKHIQLWCGGHGLTFVRTDEKVCECCLSTEAIDPNLIFEFQPQVEIPGTHCFHLTLKSIKKITSNKYKIEYKQDLNKRMLKLNYLWFKKKQFIPKIHICLCRIFSLIRENHHNYNFLSAGVRNQLNKKCQKFLPWKSTHTFEQLFLWAAI